MRPKAKLRLPAALLIAACAGLARLHGGAETNPPAPVTLRAYLGKLGYESIPLKRTKGNHLVAEALIENQTRTLLVETGAGFTELDKRVTKKWKPLGEMGAVLSDSLFSGLITNTDLFVIPELRLGNAIFTNQPAFVRSFVSPNLASVGDGLLGCDFLFRNYCLLDCRGERLYMRGGPPSAKARETLEQSQRLSGMRKVWLEEPYPRRLTCPARVNGVAVTLLLDTGAFWSIIDERVQRKCGLRPHSRPMEIRGLRRSRALLYGAYAKTLELDGIPISAATPLGVADLSDWGIGRKQDPTLRAVDGLLGHELLQAAWALIDFNFMCIWVHPQQPEKPKQAQCSVGLRGMKGRHLFGVRNQRREQDWRPERAAQARFRVELLTRNLKLDSRYGEGPSRSSSR